MTAMSALCEFQRPQFLHSQRTAALTGRTAAMQAFGKRQERAAFEGDPMNLDFNGLRDSKGIFKSTPRYLTVLSILV